jgi:hypothetical protein
MKGCVLVVHNYLVNQVKMKQEKPFPFSGHLHSYILWRRWHKKVEWCGIDKNIVPSFFYFLCVFSHSLSVFLLILSLSFFLFESCFRMMAIYFGQSFLYVRKLTRFQTKKTLKSDWRGRTHKYTFTQTDR